MLFLFKFFYSWASTPLPHIFLEYFPLGVKYHSISNIRKSPFVKYVYRNVHAAINARRHRVPSYVKIVQITHHIRFKRRWQVNFAWNNDTKCCIRVFNNSELLEVSVTITMTKTDWQKKQAMLLNGNNGFNIISPKLHSGVSIIRY